MIRAVISDLDGTLVDTAAANESAYALAFADVGVPFSPEDYRAAFGLRFEAMADRVAPEATATERAAIRARKIDRYQEQFDLLRPNDGLIALLRTVRASGLGVALASTAARANVVAVLSRLRLGDLFDVVVAGEDVVAGKPAPDCYLRAAALLGQHPADCLAVEDSAVGIAAARAAGCHVLEVAT